VIIRQGEDKMSNGVPDFGKKRGKSMLDWLVPAGMEGDIRTPMMDLEGFYQMIQDSVSASGGTTLGMPQEYGYDPYQLGFKSTGDWETFDDLMSQDWLSHKKAKIEEFHNQYLQNVNPLSPESVLSALGGGLGREYQFGEGTADPLTPAAVKPMELRDLQQLHTGYYTKDYLAPERQSLEDVYKGKKDIISSFGKGISGYGKRKGLGEAARGSFIRGMENLYSNIDKYKGSAMQRIYDTIDEWSQMTSGYGGQ